MSRKALTAVLVIAVLCCSVVAAGCAGSSGQKTEGGSPGSTPAQGSKAVSLADVVEYFKAQGFEVGEIKTKAYEMLGAVDGFGIVIDGSPVELYLFDPKTANDETKKNLEDARRIGKMSMSGISFPVVINGNVVLAGYEEHPKKDRIIEAFKAFK